MTDAIRNLTADELKTVSGGRAQTIGRSGGTPVSVLDPLPVIEILVLGTNPAPMGGPGEYGLPYYAPMQS